jgi:ABC-type transport system involved in multi-copper enzyme maturation permease subunit
MRTLLYKEVRETFRLALAGGLLLTGVLGFARHSYSVQLQGLILGSSHASGHMQPLLGEEILLFLPLFCAIFGTLLGALQGWREHRQGLWEFLVHRPVSPARLFMGKTIAGLSCYTVAAGVPLVLYAGWVITPGHVPAPFEPQMLLPILGSFLLGICCYFAGMLTIIRQARWYASKLVPLGAAFVVFGLSIFMPEFWQAVLVVLLGTLLFATATFGSFRSHGQSDKPCGLPSCATALILGIGWGLVALFAGLVLGDFISRFNERPWSYYLVSKSGGVFKVTREPGHLITVHNPEGQPAENPFTGKHLTFKDLEQSVASSTRGYIGDRSSTWDKPWWFRLSVDYVQDKITANTSWSFQNSRGRFLGYEVATGKFAGSLGPEGYAPTPEGSGARFRLDGAGFLSDSNVLYKVDVERRSVTPVVKIADGPILALSAIYDRDVERQTMMLTLQTVYILDKDGQILATTPYQPGLPEYPTAIVYRLEPRGRFAVWFEPDSATNLLRNFELPIHLHWINGQPEKAPVQLPVLNQGPEPISGERLGMALVTPPLFLEPLRWMAADASFSRWPGPLVACSVAVTTVSFLFGVWWMKRYQLPRRTQVTWGLFLIAGGLPALLACLTARQWPARVVCQSCGNVRSTDQTQCAKCGSGFSPAVRQGTEIFETA